MRTAKTLIRLADAQADLSLSWAHTHFVGFVVSWLMSFRQPTSTRISKKTLTPKVRSRGGSATWSAFAFLSDYEAF